MEIFSIFDSTEIDDLINCGLTLSDELTQTLSAIKSNDKVRVYKYSSRISKFTITKPIVKTIDVEPVIRIYDNSALNDCIIKFNTSRKIYVLKALSLCSGITKQSIQESLTSLVPSDSTIDSPEPIPLRDDDGYQDNKIVSPRVNYNRLPVSIDSPFSRLSPLDTSQNLLSFPSTQYNSLTSFKMSKPPLSPIDQLDSLKMDEERMISDYMKVKDLEDGKNMFINHERARFTAVHSQWVRNKMSILNYNKESMEKYNKMIIKLDNLIMDLQAFMKLDTPNTVSSFALQQIDSKTQ